MIVKLLIAWCLMALCVSIHAGGVTSALRWLRGRELAAQSFGPATWLFIRVAGWMVLFHLLEITVWGLFYFWTDGIARPAFSALFQLRDLYNYGLW